MRSPMNQRIADKRLHRNEQSVLGMIARIESGERGPNYGFFQYPAMAGCLATVCAITDEIFGEACDRLHIASAHRTEMLKLTTPAGARIRALAARNAPIATATSPGPLRKAEQTVLGMLARINEGPPRYGVGYTILAYPVMAGRLATICEITGESFGEACDRLHIAPAHRTEMLNLNTPAIVRIRGLATPKASIATTTSPGPLRKAEQSVLGMIARIESGERGPSYGFFQYPAIAGRLATICEITHEGFRKACDRLHIAPVHRTEMLKLDTPVGQRIRAFAAGDEVSEALG
jgi:hypothetical protein